MDDTPGHGLAPLGLAFIVFALHLPFLTLGPGLDPDAWRMVTAGDAWVSGGDYVASRLPGYPVMEGFLGLTARAGYWLPHLLIAVAHAVGAALAYTLFRRSAESGARWIALAFALHPVFFSASIELMDYGLTMPLLVGATWAAVSSRPLLAGALLGIAVGARFNYGLYLPVLLIAASGGHVRLTIAAAVVGLAALSPTLLANGAGAFTTIAGHHPFPSVAEIGRGFYHVGVELITVVAAVGLVVLAVRTPRATPSRIARAALLGIAIALTTYVRHPREIEYLLPVLFFAPFLWPGLWEGRRGMIVASLVLLGHLGVWAPRPDRPLRVWPGYVTQRLEEVRERDAHVESILLRGASERVVSIVGPLLPQVAAAAAERGLVRADAHDTEIFRDSESGSLHTYLLHAAVLDSFISAGYKPVSSEYAVPLSFEARNVNLYRKTDLLPATKVKR